MKEDIHATPELVVDVASEIAFVRRPRVIEGDSIIRIELGADCIDFRWGNSWELGTAAYWTSQARRYTGWNVRVGESLVQEIAGCMLAGHGIPTEVGLAALSRLSQSGYLKTQPSRTEGEIFDLLSRPLHIQGRPHPVRYRFARQRARRLACALQKLGSEPAPHDSFALRSWLLEFDGIGPKTASWIARNLTGLDGIAVVDIHIRRAGRAAGFFARQWRLPRDYWIHERAFQAVAFLGGTTTALLDLAIWDQLRRAGEAGGLMLGGGQQWREAYS